MLHVFHSYLSDISRITSLSPKLPPPLFFGPDFNPCGFRLGRYFKICDGNLNNSSDMKDAMHKPSRSIPSDMLRFTVEDSVKRFNRLLLEKGGMLHLTTLCNAYQKMIKNNLNRCLHVLFRLKITYTTTFPWCCVFENFFLSF